MALSGLILGYFGKKTSTAQGKYKKFVSSLVNKKYDNPLKDVIGSVFLGSPDFIKFIRDKFLSGQKSDKDHPSLRVLTQRISMKDIFDEVESAFSNDPAFARSLKMYLCQRHTGEKLKTIGDQFGIGESAVSHACTRIKVKIESDRKLKNQIVKIEKKLNSLAIRNSNPR